MTGSGYALRQLFSKADKEGFAVPAFNFSDLWDAIAIVEAAEEARAPIMLAANPLVCDKFGLDLLAPMMAALAARAKVPVFPHLDHGFSVETAIEAIRLGIPSVMIDASKYLLEENIATVNKVMTVARGYGVNVEGEIGHIKGKGIEGDYKGQGDDFLVKVADAKALAEATGISSMAVGIGSAHGFYEGKPELNFRRLAEVNAATDVYLVLHGGTGIPEEDIRKAIKGGINKINVGTIIHCTYMNGLRERLNSLPVNPYTLDVLPPVIEKIKAVVKDWIRVMMADGRA